ncbi:hypothetical protein MASR2M15_25510 [Anaerolineales bacterium]
MRHIARLIISFICAFLIWGSASAQEGQFVAFMNSAGQLLISSQDGQIRWILSDPGQTIATQQLPKWSFDGHRLLYALDLGQQSFDLRMVDAPSQSLIASTPINPFGGADWVSGQNALVAQGSELLVFNTALQSLGTFQGNLRLLQTVQTGNGVLALLVEGNAYRLFNANNTALFELPGQYDARTHGHTTNEQGLIAYSSRDESGGSLLVVVSANGTFFAHPSASTSPMQALTFTGDRRLNYRDVSGVIRIADVSCVLTSCGVDPFSSALDILPASAGEIKLNGNTLVYKDANQLLMAPITCLNTGSCNASAAVLATNVALRLPYFMADNGKLFYTGFNNNVADVSDRHLFSADLACADCGAQLLRSGALAVDLSSDGRKLVIDDADEGLNILDLASGSLVFLAPPAANWGNALPFVRWSP